MRHEMEAGGSRPCCPEQAAWVDDVRKGWIRMGEHDGRTQSPPGKCGSVAEDSQEHVFCSALPSCPLSPSVPAAPHNPPPLPPYLQHQSLQPHIVPDVLRQRLDGV